MASFVQIGGGGGGVAREGRGGVVEVAFLSQVQNIPQRINQISNTEEHGATRTRTCTHAHAHPPTHTDTRTCTHAHTHLH